MTSQCLSLSVEGTAQECAASLISQIKSRFGAVDPTLLFVFASTKQPLGALVGQITASFHKTCVLSASTAGEFTERGDHKGGVAAVAVHGDFKTFAGVGQGLSRDPEGALDFALDGLPLTVDGYPHCTGVLLVDPFAGHAEDVTLLLAMRLGDGARIAGGAAGDDLQLKATHVGLGELVAHDAVVVLLVYSKTPLGIGVRHGHKACSVALTVTDAEGSLVKQIDGKPAWPTWREWVRPFAREAGIDVDTVSGDGIGALLLRFEAALDVGEEIKIRAPLLLEGDSIRFAGEIPVGSKIRLTESTAARQIESAALAARQARSQVKNSRVSGAVVFDCICRNLILGDEFKTAVQQMSAELGGVPIAGFETYGEIALDAGDLSGFHNTTSVVLAFPEDDGG
jgi:methyl-accepting chemotaxis protein